MENNSPQEKLVDYLYEELPQREKREVEDYLQSHPDAAAELQALRRLRELCRNRLKDVPVPAGLEKRLFRELGLRRPWYSSLVASWIFKPALAGAMVMALTLGLTYKYWDRVDNTIISKTPPGGPKFAVKAGEELKYSDLLRPSPVALQPSFQAPPWRPQPSLGGGLVTLASYGGDQVLMPQNQMMRGEDINGMDQEVQHSIAQFAHQQAMRQRVMGDYRGAAKSLARVIKAYPDYPGKFEALAQRIDLLFKTGQDDIAKRELIWLGAFAPDLAYLVAERWAQ